LGGRRWEEVVLLPDQRTARRALDPGIDRAACPSVCMRSSAVAVSVHRLSLGTHQQSRPPTSRRRVLEVYTLLHIRPCSCTNRLPHRDTPFVGDRGSSSIHTTRILCGSPQKSSRSERLHFLQPCGGSSPLRPFPSGCAPAMPDETRRAKEPRRRAARSAPRTTDVLTIPPCFMHKSVAAYTIRQGEG